MPTSLGEVKGKVLRLLMKTPAKPGFYTPERVNDAIEEAIDFVAVEMFLADEGWATKIDYFTTEGGQLSIDMPDGMAMIKDVRYKYGDIYLPMIYDTANQAAQYAPDSGARQWAYTYRIVDNAFYFNPPLADGGVDYLQVEWMAYPKRLSNDTDFLESQFDKCMLHFIKYRAASMLAASLEKFVVPWSSQEQSWFAKMQAVVVQRNLQSLPIKDFSG